MVVRVCFEIGVVMRLLFNGRRIPHVAKMVARECWDVMETCLFRGSKITRGRLETAALVIRTSVFPNEVTDLLGQDIDFGLDPFASLVD